MTTPEELLREAAKIIMRDGWTQKVYGNPGSGFCALGAIRYAYEEADGAYDITEAEERLAEWLRVHEPMVGARDDFDAVTYWNDRLALTAEDVILGLKRAAEES